jgi:hypothetical protein
VSVCSFGLPLLTPSIFALWCLFCFSYDSTALLSAAAPGSTTECCSEAVDGSLARIYLSLLRHRLSALASAIIVGVQKANCYSLQMSGSWVLGSMPVIVSRDQRRIEVYPIELFARIFKQSQAAASGADAEHKRSVLDRQAADGAA